MRKNVSLNHAAETKSALDTSPTKEQSLLNVATEAEAWASAAVSTASGTFANDLLDNSDTGSWIENFNRDDTFTGGTGDDSLTSGGGWDTLIGGDGNDTLSGGDGNDALFGGNGNDRLVDNAGGAIMTGGVGNDTYWVFAGNIVAITENAAEGTDEVSVDYNFALPDNVEILRMTGNAYNGYGNASDNVFFGGIVGNHLYGEAGNDAFFGGEGADTQEGGIGNDSYTIRNDGDVIVEDLNAGTDLVTTIGSFDYTLSANLENLTLGGAGTGLGNEGANVLTGSSFDNFLGGLGGNDRLDGGAGGNDTLSGGQGNDSYYVNHLTVSVSESSGAGTDEVFTTLSLSLAAEVENLTLMAGDIHGTGNSLSNRIIGSEGHNALDGAGGTDTLTGEGGNDTYYVDSATDTIFEDGGDGTDVVFSTAASYALNFNIEMLYLLGAAVTGTGNNGDNVVIGNDLNNGLNGGGGHDLLSGGLGNDTLTGGAGNDTYYIQTTTDNVVELSGEGTDVIYSTVTYSLNGRYAETLILTGSANVSATGNSLGNTLTGNDGINTINGKGGKDILAGGLGADIFLFEAASGLDTITDFNASQNDAINVNAYTGGVANNGMLAQVGGNVVITLSAGNVITVNTALVADVLSHMVW